METTIAAGLTNLSLSELEQLLDRVTRQHFQVQVGTKPASKAVMS